VVKELSNAQTYYFRVRAAISGSADPIYSNVAKARAAKR